MGQEQTAGGRANVLERPPQAALDHFQFALDFGLHRLVAFAGACQRGQVVQPQQRQTDLLCRTIVQLGAEPAQESLVECGGASRRSTHSLVELLVLLSTSVSWNLVAELPLLPATVLLTRWMKVASST